MAGTGEARRTSHTRARGRGVVAGLAAGALAAALVLGIPAAPRAQGADCPGADSAVLAPQDLAAAALCLVEGARRDAGLPLLAADGRLRTAAQAHADQMVATDTFAVTMPDGSTPGTRAAAVGYSGPVAEVVAAGGGELGTPRHVVDGWLADPSQRAVVLAPDGRASGFGGARTTGGKLGSGANVYALMVGKPLPPQPVAGRSVVATVLRGTVLVSPPGARARAAAAVPLRGAAVVPLGSTIDATRGAVRIVAAATAGTTQSADASGGAFVPGQRKGGSGLVAVLRLAGPLRRCRGHGVLRRLTVDANAVEATTGRSASVTGIGAKWVTEDRCDGTLVRVLRGVVRVRARTGGAGRRVRAGSSRLVRHR